MYGVLTRTWWVVLARGASAVAFGAALLAWSRLSVAVLAIAFGGFALVDGTLGVVATIGAGRRDAWALLLEGVAGLAAGIVALGWPQITTATVLVVIAAWCAIRGAAELWAAWSLHRQCPREMTLAAAAITVLMAAALLGAQPAEAARALERVAGAATATAGVLLMILGARLWNWLRASHRIAEMAFGPTIAPGRERAV
jgi:uncharacterized membrane protein HdeD (DUF308 family)